MIYQALHQGLQHPLKRIFPSATVIEYFNVITSSPLFQESTHPEVASALCSTIGTTLYFSVSLAFLVSKVQVALHLYLWGQPIKGWSISIFILWVLQCHYRAHHLDKSQLVPGTCACPLLLHSSRVLMLHKSSTYCPRQISSSSLIFSMGAISMKVYPAFVSILIIASSLAIHLSTYIQPSYWLWGWAPFMALTLSLRCLRSLLWGGPKLDSYHGPHTFHPRCLRLSSWDGLILDSYHGPQTFHPRCLRLSSWDGLNLDLYHGPHTFHSRCLRLSSWDGLILDSYHGPHTFHPRCLHLSSWDGLNMNSYHGPYTFCPRCLRLSSWDGLYLGSFNGPHTFFLRCLRLSSCGSLYLGSHIIAHTPSFWGVSIRYRAVTSSFIGDVSSDSKILYHHLDLGEIIATDHIERESCGALFAIFHLDFYVSSFYAFLFDSSTYTNSLWCLHLSS